MVNFLYSSLLHLSIIALAISVSNPGCGSGMGEGEDGDKSAEEMGDSNQNSILAKKPEVVPSKEPEMSLYSVDVVSKPVAQQEAEERYVDRDCPAKSYNGVGVEHVFDVNDKGWVVSRVPSGYPASKAGLKVGDKILSKVDPRGEPGTPVTITVKHEDGTIQDLTMIRERICIAEELPE